MSEERNPNHWNVRRYYEIEAPAPQRAKQRAEKILMLPGQIYAMLVVVTHAYCSLSGKAVQANWLLILSVIVQHVGTIVVCVCVCVYLLKLICRKSFKPIHSLAKLASVYTISITSFYVLDIAAFWSLDQYRVSLTAVILLFVLVFLPGVLYCVTHSLWSIKGHIGTSCNNICQFWGNFAHSSKVYRFLHTLAVMLAASGFFFTAYSLTLPWATLNFQPDAALDGFMQLKDNVTEDLDRVIDVIDLVTHPVTRCSESGSAEWEQVRDVVNDFNQEWHVCFDSSYADYYNSTCLSLRKGLEQAQGRQQVTSLGEPSWRENSDDNMCEHVRIIVIYQLNNIYITTRI